MLQRLRRITGERNTNSIPGSNCHRRENIISENSNIFPHSDLQHNHDTYFNLTTHGGHQTPATQNSTTDINDSSVFVNDNAKNSATRHSHHFINQTQLTSNVHYHSLDADVVHCEHKYKCATPHLGISVAKAGSSGIDGKASLRPEHKFQRLVDGPEQFQQVTDGQPTNSHCKPTYVQFACPQITVKRHSSSAEIIL